MCAVFGAFHVCVVETVTAFVWSWESRRQEPTVSLLCRSRYATPSA